MDRQHEEYSWFFRTEFTGVVRTVYLILHDRQRAEDAAQDAFAQLFVHDMRMGDVVTRLCHADRGR